MIIMRYPRCTLFSALGVASGTQTVAECFDLAFDL